MTTSEFTTQEGARQRSQAVWDEMAAGWYSRRAELWEFSRPVAEWLIRRLDPEPGDTVLELAAGLGETGFRAAQRVGEEGLLICSDFASEMVAAARERAREMGIRNVAFRVLDAEQMELATDSVDGVLCRWGYMLMIEPAKALHETRRVLRPGGRLAFSVFAAPERNPWASLVTRVLVSQGHIPPPDPRAPGIFAMADPTRIRELVAAAGFAEPEIEEMTLQWRFVDQEAYWQFLLEAAGAISPILRALPPAAQSTVRHQLHEAAKPFYSGDGYDFLAVVLNVVTS
ncbi:MAG: methyltransferase domain-containing protein [Chloroflexota bacterium]|nr:methyltransferase domain-containing protein [Chloroflexota bacterium]